MLIALSRETSGLPVKTVFRFCRQIIFILVFGTIMAGSLAGAVSDSDIQLLKASEQGNLRLVKKLLNEGAHIEAASSKGWRPLHFAAYSNSVDVVKFLVSEGAEVNSKNSKGCTPLHSAAVCGNTEISVFLIKSGAPVSLETSLQTCVNGYYSLGWYLITRIDQKVFAAILFPLVLAVLFISIRFYKWMFCPREPVAVQP